MDCIPVKHFEAGRMTDCLAFWMRKEMNAYVS